MNQRTKDLWVIPSIIALATGIPLGAGFMFLGLWLAGTPIKPSFSLEWLRAALFASLPVWGARGRQFESARPDHYLESIIYFSFSQVLSQVAAIGNLATMGKIWGTLSIPKFQCLPDGADRTFRDAELCPDCTTCDPCVSIRRTQWIVRS
jgi:hypothetical protein